VCSSRTDRGCFGHRCASRRSQPSSLRWRCFSRLAPRFAFYSARARSALAAPGTWGLKLRGVYPGPRRRRLRDRCAGRWPLSRRDYSQQIGREAACDMLQAVTELFGCGTVHIFGSLAQQVLRDAGPLACMCQCSTTDGPCASATAKRCLISVWLGSPHGMTSCVARAAAR
jgi:hypothetical protein